LRFQCGGIHSLGSICREPTRKLAIEGIIKSDGFTILRNSLSNFVEPPEKVLETCDEVLRAVRDATEMREKMKTSD
jgi:hypothetical protein